MVLSASSVASLTDYGSPWYFFLRQLLWTVLGVVAFVVAIRVDYRQLARASCVPLLIVSVVLLVARADPRASASTSSGSRRWLGVGVAPVPAERARQARAAPLRRRPRSAGAAGEIGDWRRVVQPGRCSCSACSAFLVMREPDLGSTLVLALIVGRGARRRRRAAAPPRGASARCGASRGHAPRDRRAVPAGPHAHVPRPVRRPDERGLPDHAVADRARQRRAGPASGSARAGPSGTSSRTRTPTSSSRSSARSSASSAALLVLGLFVALRACSASAPRCARPTGSARCSRPASPCGSSGRPSINIGAVVGLLPVTGIPLPFVSFGGSALVTTMFAAGMLVNVAPPGRDAATPRRTA